MLNKLSYLHKSGVASKSSFSNIHFLEFDLLDRVLKRNLTIESTFLENLIYFDFIFSFLVLFIGTHLYSFIRFFVGFRASLSALVSVLGLWTFVNGL